ncbi:quercetin 2,3-dioxygenase [Paenibacillus sp. CCS19]|uniref:pirin family protein n=1 Tax=Paenibacillus sp. CCS19 TaxID=3158387 RepID=UPI0025635C82|nr:pirin family protein [Paenibacillus cellulosilyticus]GMK38722.1 quercetin 2,3-dioxygenase [Paenibacillus cellulosilyticus]
MIAMYPADQRYHASHGWLESYFSFSFADYYDPNNMQFGPMRVLNDDYIAASEGFGMHPHREMEIVTLVLSGRLEHQDSMGNRANTTWGGIQRMSAGTGVFHSEMNPSEEEPVELLQMWFMPASGGLEPSYETSSFDPQSLSGQLVPIVSGNAQLQQAGKVAVIHQDMTMYLTELAEGQSVQFHQGAGRRVFLFVLEGSVNVKGGPDTASLGRRDSARIEGQAELTIAGQTKGSNRVLIIDLP